MQRTYYILYFFDRNKNVTQRIMIYNDVFYLSLEMNFFNYKSQLQQSICNISMKIRLYIDYISQPARTVLAFCLINRIPIEITEVRVAKLQHLTQQYIQINPMKKVPAMVDPQNGLSLGQSHAIVNYLMRKYKLQQKWGLDNEITRAKVDEYLHYHHQNTRKCAGILYTEVFSRLYPVQHGQTLKNTSPRQDVKNVLDFIEEHYFKESSFMIGKTMTVADLAAYLQIHSLVVVYYDYSKWKNIVRWMAIMEKIPEMQQTNHNFIRLLPKISPPKPKI